MLLAAWLATAPVYFAGAQSPSPTSAGTADLVPIVVDNGLLDGEAVLAVTLDATGKVDQTTLLSGRGELYTEADRVTRMFSHKPLAGSTSALQHVYFWKKKPGMQKVPPIYPPIAKAAHVSGTVKLIASVAVDGQVSQIAPISGPPMLIGSAIDAVKQWIYPQVRIHDQAEPYHVIVDVNFKLM
jgi:hypothetical protein